MEPTERTSRNTRFIVVPAWLERILVRRRPPEESREPTLDVRWTGGPRAEHPLCRRYGHVWSHPVRDADGDRRCKRCGRWLSGRIWEPRGT